MRKSTRGFTLVEIIIVIIVLGILAAIVVGIYSTSQARTRDTKRRADIINISKALELYYDDNGQYPAANPSGTTVPGLNSYWYESADASWAKFATQMSGQIDSLPKDPLNVALSPHNTANGYSYAYLSYTTWCNNRPYQWYILVFRYEVTQKERLGSGTCPDGLGNTYFNNGASIYLMVR